MDGTRPTIRGHDASTCANCKNTELTQEEWADKHLTQWCKNTQKWINKDDTLWKGDLTADGHTRCNGHGGVINSKKRNETYDCQCQCHAVSDDEVEEAAFKALQLVLEMRANAQHQP